MQAHPLPHPAAAREAKILAHYPLVRAIAGRWVGRLGPDQELNELINLGMLGLIEAVDRFDAARQLTFRTYAATRINGAIVDGLRARDWAPHSVRRNRSRVDRARRSLLARLGRPPRRAEIASELELTMARFERLERKILERRVISATPGREAEAPLVERLPAASDVDDLETRQLVTMARSIIDGLPETERAVLQLRYLEGCSQQQAAQRLGLSASRVSQLHRRGLERARLRARQRLAIRA